MSLITNPDFYAIKTAFKSIWIFEIDKLLLQKFNEVNAKWINRIRSVGKDNYRNFLLRIER